MALLAGRYRIERRLGQGGMGEVHLAHDAMLERRVAIKMLPASLEHDAQARQRFRREALAAAALDHPFICKIYEVGEDQGRSFIAMEYVEGRTLDAAARDGRLSARELLDVAHEIAQAFDEAHRRGLIHRDLKPSNVMLTIQGHVKVLDFGLAKALAPAAAGATADGATRLDVQTDPGTRVGTPAYMSPEQILGGPLDPRSDVFAFGTVLHELACGTHPFMRAAAHETMSAILRDPPSATEGDLDVVPGFGRVVHRMLAKACAERFQTMDEVTAALDALRGGGASGTPASGSSAVSVLRDERTVFVARDAELAELSTAIDRMLLGQGGMILLGGEPGVGKTRLAREAQRIAHARGCLVTTGQCYEQEGAPPFGPFVEIVEYGARVLPQALRAALGPAAAEIATMVPSLRRTYPDIPAPVDAAPEQQRRILFNAYLEYSQRVTQKSAIVLLLDDLHWADEPSLQLLLHVAPHLPAMRLLVIGTYRDVELDAERPFARTLEQLLRQRLATRLNVKRLSAAAVERLLTTMSGAPPPSSFVKAVYEETDGNPFFVEEVFQHLAEEGKLFDPEGRWKPDLKAGEIDVPEGVRLVVSRRLQRLGETARKVLTAAAVVGRSFPLDLVLAVAGEAEDAVLDVIEETERAQLIVAERGRQPRYTFVHELIRSTLVSAMALPRRQRLHLRVADAIEQLRSASLDAHISMLAHHLYQAGAAADPDRAVAHLLRAADRAYLAGGFEDALGLADQVLSFDLEPDAAARARAEGLRCTTLFALGRLEEATAPGERAVDIWIACRDDAGIARAARIASGPPFLLRRFDLAAKIIGRALAALSSSAGEERCVLQAWQATLTAGVKPEEAVALWDAAVHTAEPLGDERLQAWVRFCGGVVDICLGRALAGEERLRGATPQLPSLRDRALACSQWAIASYLTGDVAALTSVLSQLRPLAEQGGNVLAASVWRWMTALVELEQHGRLRGYRDFNESELPSTVLLPFTLKMAAAVTGFYLGERDRALDAMRALIAETPATGFLAGYLEANAMAMHAWAGSYDAARSALPAVSARFARLNHDNALGKWGAAMVSVPALALLSEREACASLYPTVRAFADLGNRRDGYSMGPITPVLAAGIAADAAGNADLARDHFEDTLRFEDANGSRLYQPAVRFWFGRHLTARADTDSRIRGVALLTDAANQFAELGMLIHQQHAARELESVSV